MAASPTVLLPVRDFDGMSRLARVLDPYQRRALARKLCARAASAAHEAKLKLVVISSSGAVAGWADEQGSETWPDPGIGLSGAASAGVEQLGRHPWIVLHADLPLVTAGALRMIAEAASNATVLVPSQDGGTNLIASEGPFPFAYGPGSFHRHFAAVPNATIVSSAELSIDIDSPAQLAAFPKLVELPSVPI